MSHLLAENAIFSGKKRTIPFSGPHASKRGLYYSALYVFFLTVFFISFKASPKLISEFCNNTFFAQDKVVFALHGDGSWHIRKIRTGISVNVIAAPLQIPVFFAV